MESLVKLQLDTKSKIEKGRVNFKKSPKERLTQGYVDTRLELVQEQWQIFNETHRKIIEEATKEDMKHAYFTLEVYDTTEETYIIYRSELKDCNVKGASKKTEQDSGQLCNVKLPKINITTFSGKYTEWTSFHDLFTSLVHNNKSLENVQKLQYLKGSLSGEAEQLLRQIPITAANYTVCWEQLKHRYNNKRHLANCILQRLLGQRRSGGESAAALKDLLDTTSDCLSALNNIGVDVTTWDIIIIHIISSKLDQETRKQWELKVSADNSNELPKLDQFKSFIESRFRALEVIEPQRSTGQTNITHSSSHKVYLATNQSEESSNLRCEYCSESHKLCFCKSFVELDLDQKRLFVAQNKICFNCLGGNHMVNQCKKPTTCRICRRRHHTLLHLDDLSSNTQKSLENKQRNSSEDTRASEESVPLVSCLSTKKIACTSQVLLATALVKAQTATKDFQVVRALLDQGSQASFVTEATVQFLRLKKSPIRGVVSSLGTEKTIVANYTVLLMLQSLTEGSFEIEVMAYVLKNITSYLPERQVEPMEWVELDNLVLADPHFSKPNRIDILLGAEVYSKVLRNGVKRSPNGWCIAQCTSLGWIISGTVQRETKMKHKGSNSTNKITVMHAQVENDILKQFWEIEDQLPTSGKFLTEEEQKCEELFAATTRRTLDGRYVVKLPFREQAPTCAGGNSRVIAVKRFKSLERKFSRDTNLKEKYKNVIHEYVQLKHMRKIQTEADEANKTVYLPHHAVIREDKSTTKVRVVFDASCKNDNGVSLNDTLMVGPTLQSDLRHIVLRWRTHRIALVADIVKMYRQVQVKEEDTAYQRIVWRDSPEEELQDYELTTVTFGTASAPYLAVKALHQIAIDEAEKFPTASAIVPTSYYMDDMMSGCSTVAEGQMLYIEMRQLLGRAGFELQKWNSNNKELLKEIDCYREETEDMKGKSDNEIEEKEIFDSTKILGLTWCRRSDEFKYTVQLSSTAKIVTKRNIISDIARLFDPLGWIAPSIIIAKVLIQKLWLAGVDWDDAVPETLKREWQSYREELVQLSKVRVPRWLGMIGSDGCVELHGFSDASKAAYAAVVYTRTVDSANRVRVSLLVAKTKVAPIKQVSIPRLELCGAVIVARLLADVAKAMNIPKGKLHAWTDSTVVLAWLNSHPSRWKTFVGNRVSEILSTLDASQWAHISSKDNPADCASRGVPPSILAENKLWFEGPSFLLQNSIIYHRPMNTEIHLEESVRTHLTVIDEVSPWIKFSSLSRLLRVVAFCRRFIHSKNRKDRPKYLQKRELEEALKCCIRYYQNKEFQDEYKQIKENTTIKVKDSKIKSLFPFIDKDDILRVGGRLQEAPLSDQVKHPIILPHKAHLTKLLVADAHEQTLHGGPQLMINYLRSAYWILGVRSLVKQQVRKCVTCVKHKAQVNTQLMGSLPAARCTPTRPFLHSGLDYAGPINIRTTKGRGHRAYKGYW